MGQRMPDKPIDYGTNCVDCFDTDKTPKFVYVRFSLIEICPGELDPNCITPPNDRLFKLEQVDGYPCQFRYDTEPWHIFWTFSAGAPAKSSIHLRDWSDSIYFAALPAACLDEGTVIHNDLVGCVLHDCAHGGICCVTWTPQATELLEAINLKKAYDLFMELFPLEDGNLVYKFCRLKDSTNIKILFEP